MIPSPSLWNSKPEKIMDPVSLQTFVTLCYKLYVCNIKLQKKKKGCLLCCCARETDCQPNPNPPDNYWHPSRAAFNGANIRKEENLYMTGMGDECLLKFIAEALPYVADHKQSVGHRLGDLRCHVMNSQFSNTHMVTHDTDNHYHLWTEKARSELSSFKVFFPWSARSKPKFYPLLPRLPPPKISHL